MDTGTNVTWAGEAAAPYTSKLRTELEVNIRLPIDELWREEIAWICLHKVLHICCRTCVPE